MQIAIYFNNTSIYIRTQRKRIQGSHNRGAAPTQQDAVRVSKLRGGLARANVSI